ncbi:MAG: hypothetical protein WCQ41_09175 [Bacillota bacterium]
MFARLIYYGVTQLRRVEHEVWLMPLGELLDHWEIHKQYIGEAKPRVEVFIDDVIPEYLI